MTPSGFHAAVELIFSERHWPHAVSPATLTGSWADFVKQCKRGYPDNIYEYYNDIRVREWIEIVLARTDLAVFDEHRQFREVVAEIDAEFQGLLQTAYAVPRKNFWWERGVLSFAGSELALDFVRDYGISIAIKDK